MSFFQFSFQTSAFADPPEKLAENVNGIHGYALAFWLSGALRVAGLDATDCWAEDHGSDFSVVAAGSKYLLACSLDDGEGGVVLHKSRSLGDKLFGRNRLTADDTVIAAVRAALSGNSDISAKSKSSSQDR